MSLDHPIVGEVSVGISSSMLPTINFEFVEPCFAGDMLLIRTSNFDDDN